MIKDVSLPLSSTPTEKLDIEEGRASAIALDPFGKPLSPQPTNDPYDPLNWASPRKYSIIAIVCLSYFVMIYAVAAPIMSFTQLQVQFDATYTEINWTFAISNLGASVGPLFHSSLGDIIGRRPVLILGTALSIVATGCSALPNITIEGYSAARFFQIFGATPAITIGLSIINDLSWQHERGFRVGLWVLSIDVGSYFGPFFGGFVADKAPNWMQLHVLILFSVLILLQAAFVPETLYPRAAILENPEIISNKDDLLRRTTQLPFLTFRAIPGVQHPAPWQTVVDFFRIFALPIIAIPIITFSLSLYWWIISVETMVPVAYANYSIIGQGLLFLGLIVGTLTAEILFSGWVGDLIVGKLSTGRGIARTPEMRIWLAYPGIIMFAAGLVLWGSSIENSYHFMVGQVAFFMSMFYMTHSDLRTRADQSCSWCGIADDEYGDCRVYD
ncbi:hypothetical protein J7T55_010430 [Diaporthe amygdali]|uniref:uncharacterized protein n=1 Tax=Phomopsis amygdali TaxID=1214568 RepID=UPI0022FDC5AE|nr:uncharacterized protein J7T55_010430 [Diaporthe amygdali]KAJ0115607.1 hypothetical protein J7T55_010430 [Diaporthe amygdali]